MNPLVSVILPVYNCPHYVGASIGSILAQSYTNLELVVIDDGSTDRTPEVLRQYDDPRIRLITQENRGLAGTLNRGIELACGQYIARQDQDDVSFPGRLARQVEFLDAHPRCGLVGTWAEIWLEDKRTKRVHAHPSGNADLKFELLLNNPFVHSSVMIRRLALDRVGLYSTDTCRQPPEDFELWSRIAGEYEVANIPEALHAYREVRGSMSRDGPSPFVDHMVKISSENIARASGVPASDAQAVNIAALTHRAEHLLQGVPDFVAMRHILQNAAIRVTGDAGPDFVRKAGRRVDALRLRLWEIRHRRGWQRHLAHAARGIARLVRGS